MARILALSISTLNAASQAEFFDDPTRPQEGSNEGLRIGSRNCSDMSLLFYPSFWRNHISKKNGYQALYR